MGPLLPLLLLSALPGSKLRETTGDPVVCGGDFNQWIRELTSTAPSSSYMFTKRNEIL